MLTGTEAAIDATLAAANGLTYEGNLDFTGSGAHSDTLTVTENDSSAVFTAEASVGINVEAAVHPSLWGTVSYPSPAITGERFLPLSAAINGSLETGLLLFGEAANFNQTGVNTVNESALTVDPFLLPYQDGVPTPTASSLSLTSPFKYSDILVNTDQGIAFYEIETAPGTVDQAGTIVQVALTDSDGPDNPLASERRRRSRAIWAG